MAYNNKISDNKNCTEHRFPRSDYKAIRSIGTVEYVQCNNCLAVKITWISDERIDGVWIKVTDERVIEPNLTPELGGAVLPADPADVGEGAKAS